MDILFLYLDIWGCQCFGFDVRCMKNLDKDSIFQVNPLFRFNEWDRQDTG